MKTVHILIRGKVQGVFFRASASKAADAIGVQGWIKNNEEGEVEASVTGTPTQVDEFIEWCKVGPRGARVEEVSITEKRPEPYTGFRIIK